MTLKNIRNLKAKAQGGRCFYCQHPSWTASPTRFARKHGLTKSQTKWFLQTAEHLVPSSEGGSNAAGNIVMACYYCNSRRHRCCKPLAPDAYLQKVRARLARGRWHGCSVRT